MPGGGVKGRHARHSSRNSDVRSFGCGGEPGTGDTSRRARRRRERPKRAARSRRAARPRPRRGRSRRRGGRRRPGDGAGIERFGPGGAGLGVAALYDAGEERAVARSLERAGLGTALGRGEMERLGFFACDEDLEAELIRALGVRAVEEVVAGQGELRVLFTCFSASPPSAMSLSNASCAASSGRTAAARSATAACSSRRSTRPGSRARSTACWRTPAQQQAERVLARPRTAPSLRRPHAGHGVGRGVDAACEVEVLGHTARTFEISGPPLRARAS